MKFPTFLLSITLFTGWLVADDAGTSVSAYQPAAIGAEDYASLRGISPFLRALNLSDSLILTGFAEVKGERVATILNKDTKETYVVSGQPNSQGWKMVDLNMDPDIEKSAVKVAIDGGEVVTVRYMDFKLKAGEAKPAAGPSTEPNGGPTAIMAANRRRGGRRGGPSPEMREKMSQLSDAQRSQLFERMRAMRESRPEMSWEERSKIFSAALNEMTTK